MAKKEKPVSEQAKAEGAEWFRRFMAFLDQNKPTPVNRKETERRLDAMEYDLRHPSGYCARTGTSPLVRLETFRNLGYFVP